VASIISVTGPNLTKKAEAGLRWISEKWLESGRICWGPTKHRIDHIDRIGLILYTLFLISTSYPTVKKGIVFKTERSESSTIRQQMTGLTDAVIALHASLTNRIGDRSVVRLTHLMLSRNE